MNGDPPEKIVLTCEAGVLSQGRGRRRLERERCLRRCPLTKNTLVYLFLNTLDLLRAAAHGMHLPRLLTKLHRQPLPLP
jgi:hypothetical protein